jgi:hypothetical protein
MEIILSVPDEDYSERTQWRLFWAYPMKIILSVPDEDYSERTRWRLFQKHVAYTKEIWVFLTLKWIFKMYNVIVVDLSVVVKWFLFNLSVSGCSVQIVGA